MIDQENAKNTQGSAAKEEVDTCKFTGAEQLTKTMSKVGNHRHASALTQSRKFVGLIWVLILLALFLAIYGISQTRHIAHLQQFQKTQQQQQISTLQTNQAQELLTLQNTIQAKNSQLQKQLQTIDVALQDALQKLAVVHEQQGDDSLKWDLAEAEYLLRLANQRLAVEQNRVAPVAFLKAADKIMLASQQLGGYAVRQAIAKDSAALMAVPVIDTEDIYARLSALIMQVSRLTYITPTMEKLQIKTSKTAAVVKPESQITAALEPLPLTWRQQAWQVSKQVLSNVWAELKTLVRIRHRNITDKTLLTPAAERLLRVRIELVLSQAQVALLRQQQVIYEASLAQAKGLLKDYYGVNDLAVQKLLQQITHLGQIKLLAQMPDISGSLYAMQDLLAQPHGQQHGD